MKYIGIQFQVPDEDFKLSIYKLLEPINPEDFVWEIDNDEIYIRKNGEITNELLFSDEDNFIEGEQLKYRLINNELYPIFLTLRAFHKEIKDKLSSKPKNKYEFMNSPYEIIFEIVDSDYLNILCKNKGKLEILYANAKKLKFKNVKYIDEN
jgi:hypothetical protein